MGQAESEELMLPPPTSCLPAKDLGVFLGPAAGYTPPRNVFCASATDVEYGSMQALIIGPITPRE